MNSFACRPNVRTKFTGSYKREECTRIDLEFLIKQRVCLTFSETVYVQPWVSQNDNIFTVVNLDAVIFGNFVVHYGRYGMWRVNTVYWGKSGYDSKISDIPDIQGVAKKRLIFQPLDYINMNLNFSSKFLIKIWIWFFLKCSKFQKKFQILLQFLGSQEILICIAIPFELFQGMIRMTKI